MLRALVALSVGSGALAFNAGARQAPPVSRLHAHTATAVPTANRPAARAGPTVLQRPSVQQLRMLESDKPLKVGVVGVTGAVGQEVIDVLGKRSFPVSELKLFASARSAGKEMATPFGDLKIEEFTLEAARGCDVVFLAVSGDFALEWAEKIAEGEDGALVIDNSSAFRYTDGIPLVVPEINAEAARKSKKKIVANPNCTTAIALMALAPLHKEFGIKRCIMSTYQAASGAGAPGMQELEEGTKAYVAGDKVSNSVFAHQLPFNVIPHIDKFLDDKYTKEERKVTWETRKIMDLPDLPVSCTCVRIPTLRAHAESITIETEKPVEMDKAYEVLNAATGVVVTDDISQNLYPMPITASKKYDVEVGRLRLNDVFGDYGLDMFVVGDQLLRGAALNAVLIAEAVM
jgi:aspartate-semialdehyde dehydrogenase